MTGTTYDKSKEEISQNFAAFSEYMNFMVTMDNFFDDFTFYYDLFRAIFGHFSEMI